ncbi:MAG: ribosome recycling factor [Candidatus Omnitrophota bacterium]
MAEANAQTLVHDAEDKMKKALEVTSKEFATIRTGRASPALVENIKVEYYGNPTPLRQLATISIPDPRLIVIQPWDVSSLQEVEKAILKSELGITPSNDGKLIRLSLPSLTHERREELAKLVKKIAEDGRVSVRTIRRDANEHIKKLEKDKSITEDGSFSSQEQVQKLTDKYISRIDEALKGKEKEILEV